MDDAKAKVAALQLPPGTYVQFTGAAAAQAASATRCCFIPPSPWC